jgi:hypothetical protein
MGDRKIPNPVIAAVADVLGSYYYSHTGLNILFADAGALGEAPPGSCVRKCDKWLRLCNDDPNIGAFQVLGRVLENFMEVQRETWSSMPSEEHPDRQRVRDVLARYGLSYQSGGIILGAGSSPASKSLQQLLRAKDLSAVDQEFKRALSHVESDPPASVTAASSLLESLFKVYIEDNALQLPSKQVIGELFKVVRSHLRIDPSHVVDDDLKRILSGLISVADGIGSLRSHAGSAHGQGRKGYKLEARHARLAINSAHSVAVFVIETWARRAQNAG